MAAAADALARQLESRLTLRLADYTDMETLWRWRNDPATRATALSSEEVPWLDHIDWLSRAFADNNMKIFIGLVDGEPVGASRHRRVGDSADCSLVVAPEHRGRSLAYPLFMGATALLFAESFVDRIYAYIKVNNAPCLALLRRSPYTELGRSLVQGADVAEFELTRAQYIATETTA